jgi:predicted MPP superfamily phosphohydrolase
MEAMGIRVLANSYEVFHSEGEKMVIAGVHDPCGPFDQKSPQQLMDEIRQKEGKDSFVLMLAHRNGQLSMWSELGADLVLTGHCHGGVVRLPFVGGIFGPGRELFPEYDSGLYTEGDTNLYVSRGLGYSRVKMRVLNRPHLPILLLKGK